MLGILFIYLFNILIDLIQKILKGPSPSSCSGQGLWPQTPAQLPALAAHHYHGISWDFDILLMPQLQKVQRYLTQAGTRHKNQ